MIKDVFDDILKSRWPELYYDHRIQFYMASTMSMIDTYKLTSLINMPYVDHSKTYTDIIEFIEMNEYKIPFWLL